MINKILKCTATQNEDNKSQQNQTTKKTSFFNNLLPLRSTQTSSNHTKYTTGNTIGVIVQMIPKTSLPSPAMMVSDQRNQNQIWIQNNTRRSRRALEQNNPMLSIKKRRLFVLILIALSLIMKLRTRMRAITNMKNSKEGRSSIVKCEE